MYHHRQVSDDISRDSSRECTLPVLESAEGS